MHETLGFVPFAFTAGDQPFHTGGEPLGVTVGDFWRWAYSDLLMNTERGAVAEYLIACALGVTTDVREGWAAYDLTSAVGVRVEVKSSAYVQRWKQKSLLRDLVWNSAYQSVGPRKRHI